MYEEAVASAPETLIPAEDRAELTSDWMDAARDESPEVAVETSEAIELASEVAAAATPEVPVTPLKAVETSLAIEEPRLARSLVSWA
jgi:hypothetical protein